MKLLISALLVLSSISSARASDMENYDVYYVAVGNAHYATPDRSQYEYGFYPVKGARISARLVAEYLQQGGSKYGVLLESQKDVFVTKQDILNAIKSVTDSMDFESTNERLFVFYYCGHGIGEAVSGRQYLIPGDLVVDSASLEQHFFDLDALEQELIYSVDLLEDVRKYSDQQLVMLDNCYEEPDETKVLEYFTQRLGTKLNAFTTSLREIHQFRDPFNSVFYASTPGATIRPVAAPEFLRKRTFPYLLGRISRKFCLYANDVKMGERSGDYHSMLNFLNSSEVDELTSSVRTYSGMTYHNKAFLGYDQENLQEPKVIAPTGANASKLLATENSVGSPVAVLMAEEGVISIKSEANDWVGGGKTHYFTPDSGEIMVMNQGKHLVIRFQELEQYEYFDFEIVLPDKYAGPVAEGAPEDYYWFEHEPVTVSATGKGCSSSIGKRKILELKRDAKGRMTNIRIEFDHRCDDSKAKLQGLIDLRVKPVIG